MFETQKRVASFAFILFGCPKVVHGALCIHFDGIFPLLLFFNVERFSDDDFSPPHASFHSLRIAHFHCHARGRERERRSISEPCFALLDIPFAMGYFSFCEGTVAIPSQSRQKTAGNGNGKEHQQGCDMERASNQHLPSPLPLILPWAGNEQ